MSGTNEVRVTDPRTGGQKGSKDERFDLIPARPMQAVARHYGIGAKKYDDDNWRLGYSWRLSIASLERHLNAFKDGEDIDHDVLPDGTPTESPHMAAVVFHALALLEFAETHPELDDRWKPTDVAGVLSLDVNEDLLLDSKIQVGDVVEHDNDGVKWAKGGTVTEVTRTGFARISWPNGFETLDPLDRLRKVSVRPLLVGDRVRIDDYATWGNGTATGGRGKIGTIRELNGHQGDVLLDDPEGGRPRQWLCDPKFLTRVDDVDLSELAD